MSVTGCEDENYYAGLVVEVVRNLVDAIELSDCVVTVKSVAAAC